MSSRIIRGSERIKRPTISSPAGSVGGLPRDHVMTVEKQAFEKGYHEGERMGKQMGEQMIGTVVKRYDQSIVQFAIAHKSLLGSMERKTVQLALEIAKTILEREVSTDPDVVTALVTLALKRLEGHHEITLKVSADDLERVRAAIEHINPAVAVAAEPTLERGDFLVDTSKTHLDGRMMSRINSVGRVLFEQS